MDLKDKNIGFCLTGSFCTFKNTILQMKELVKEDANVIPIMSYKAYKSDTKFGKAKDYINEIEALIKERDFNITKRLLLQNFKTNALQLYIDKDEEKLKVVKRHLEAISFLFGDTALALILDKECSMDELCFKTLKLKEEIREKYSFKHACGGYITKDNNISHINIAHCPDPSVSLFNRDLNFLLKTDSKVVGDEDLKKIKKYRSYNI